MLSHSRVSPGILALATVSLLSAAACEKAKPAKNPALTVVPVGVPAVDLAAKPQVLFQVFGERESPHMMPIAAIVNGAITPIGLTLRGWKQLDSIYMPPGTTYPFYAEGGNPGELTVQRDTSYSLPGCSAVKPMSVVQLSFKHPRSDPTVEFLVSSGTVAPPRAAPTKMMSSAEITKLARTIGHEAGKQAHLSAAEMDSLDFNARMIETGASAAPTLVISFIDPNSGEARSGAWTSHLFALADSGANGYQATYVHAVKGNAKTVEFQRLMNHIDFNGDGADEIIVEAWKYAADNDLVVLTFKDGKWHEAMRAKQSWCLDAPKEK
jgi:hypothetical protein